MSAGTQMQNLFLVSLSNVFLSKSVILTRGQRRSLRGRILQCFGWLYWLCLGRILIWIWQQTTCIYLSLWWRYVTGFSIGIPSKMSDNWINCLLKFYFLANAKAERNKYSLSHHVQNMFAAYSVIVSPLKYVCTENKPFSNRPSVYNYVSLKGMSPRATDVGSRRWNIWSALTKIDLKK